MVSKPTYTHEFKQEAADLVLTQGYGVSEAAKNLGVSESALRRWVRARRSDDTPVSHLNHTDLKAIEIENHTLKKKLKRLEMERDILKKAAAFFANEPL